MLDMLKRLRRWVAGRVARWRRLPIEYRGVRLTEDERGFLEWFLRDSVWKIASRDQQAMIEHLWVADGLCMYAKILLKRAREEESPCLARSACESAERATLVAPDESLYTYRLAGFLDAAGFDNATDYYRKFLERSSRFPGSLAYSPVHKPEFQEAVEKATVRLGTAHDS